MAKKKVPGVMPWWLWLIFWAQFALIVWNVIRPTVHISYLMLGPALFAIALKWHRSRSGG